MSSRLSKLTTILAAGVLALGVVHSHRAEAGAGLRFCVDGSSPLADTGKQLAHAAAKAQGYEAVIHTFNGHGHGDDPFELDRFKMMVPADCDLVLGYPADPNNPSIPPGLKATPAYAHTGFVLVAKDSLPDSLDDLPDGTVVGVQWSTRPNLYVLKHDNLTADVHSPYRSGTLAALAGDEDDVAMVWQPSLMAYAKQHPKAAQWSSRIMDQPDAHWDIVALYGSKTKAAAQHFEKGLAKLADQGKLAPLLDPLGAAKPDPDALNGAGSNTSATGGDPSKASGGAGSDGSGSGSTSSDSAASEDGAANVASSPGSAAEDNDNGGQGNQTGESAKSAGASGGSAAGPWSKKLYTQAQANQGHGVYARYCASCHGAQLEGHTGPSLKGSGFASKAMGFTVSAMFSFMANQMPAGGTSNRLDKQQYAQLMAFILSENGYAAGDQKLTYEQAQKSQVPLISRQ